MRWFTNFIIYLLLGCAFIPPHNIEPEIQTTIQISLVFHIRSEEDLSRIELLLKSPKELLAKENVEIDVSEIIIGVPNLHIQRFEDRKSFEPFLDNSYKTHIFFVNTLYDKDGEKPLYGLSVKYEMGKCKSFIIIPESTSLSTIGHELGHEFGLSHNKNPKNMMSTGIRLLDATFTSNQIKIMKRRIEKKKRACS